MAATNSSQVPLKMFRFQSTIMDLKLSGVAFSQEDLSAPVIIAGQQTVAVETKDANLVKALCSQPHRLKSQWSRKELTSMTLKLLMVSTCPFLSDLPIPKDLHHTSAEPQEPSTLTQK
jgi:hypothetical protein